MSARPEAEPYDSVPDSDFETGPDSQRLRRKTKKPTGRRRVAELSADKDGQIADATIRRLTERGHITEVVAELKSGKEATAYIAETGSGPALLKIYRDFAARSFKNDAIYREGQVVTDDRARRAMQNRSSKGLNMLQAEWVMSEYAHMWRLWLAGLNVPEPLVGPHAYVYAETVPAVLMRLIGTPEAPAPRLSDARLTPDEARSAWNQSVRGMAEMLRLGYAHGDYSAYNLLWWENTVYIIDFPQLSTRQNPNFDTLLRRDAQSLASSFRRHGIQTDAEATLREVQRHLSGPAPTPRPEPRVVLP